MDVEHDAVIKSKGKKVEDSVGEHSKGKGKGGKRMEGSGKRELGGVPGTEKKYLENSAWCSSASMGALEVPSRLVEGQTGTIRGRLEQVKIETTTRTQSFHASFDTHPAGPVQGRARRVLATPCHQRKAIRRRSGRAA